MGYRLSIRWRIGPTVASGALVCYRHLGVVPFCWFPCVCAVAADAVGRGWNMGSQLSSSRTAVVASRAVCRCGVQAMVWLGARPSAGGFMACLTHGLTGVYCSRWSSRQPKIGTQMASCALAGYRDRSMKLDRSPGHVATFVAGVAVGNRYTRERCIRYVVGRFSIRRGISAAMAGRTLIRHRNLRMVPLGRLPSSGAMATDAVGSGWNVGTQFSRCATAIVATGAIGCRGIQTMVWLRASPTGRRLMASLANRLTRMDSGCGSTGQPKTCIQMATRALARQ